MQQALQIQTVIDENIVANLPELKPLLGHRVQIITLDLETEQTTTDNHEQKISFQEFLQNRTAWQKNKPPISLEQMEQAITQGATERANF